MVRDLIVVKVKINGTGPYNFILDTGVGLMLITDPKLTDSVGIVNKRVIKIAGLGDREPIEAILTPPLKVDIEGLQSHGVSAAVFKDDVLELSNYTGIHIHGLLGYEFFNQLAVKINFSDSTLLVGAPKHMRFFSKGSKIPIKLEGNKPFVNAKVTFANGTAKQSKLVVDLGAGHFLSMENLENKSILQNSAVSANLGMTVTGFMNGTVSRIKELDIGKYKMKDVITSFPDYDENLRVLLGQRDGNLGIGMLKKFDIIFNYQDSAMYLKPGRAFKQKEEHDMSGLIYYADMHSAEQQIMIYKVEPGSAAEIAGLKPKDEIVEINFKPASQLSMQRIDNLFKSTDGRKVILGIYRDQKYIDIILTLKRRI